MSVTVWLCGRGAEWGVSNPGYGEYTIYGKTSASVLILGFRYVELRNIYKRISNCIRIPIFSSKFVHR